VKIKITRRIEVSGKIEDKSAEAEIPDGGCTNEDTALQARASGMARALFESMNPPMVAVPSEPSGSPFDEYMKKNEPFSNSPRTDALSRAWCAGRDYGRSI
jgi:hypothetical protein